MHSSQTSLATGLIGAALLAVGLSGCSGSSGGTGGPGGDTAGTEGTSVAQLCGALTDFQADLATADSADATTYVAQLKAAATRLGAVGLPDEMPADARAGFTQQVTLITSLPDAATEADLAAVGTAAEDPALKTYLATACPAAP